MSSSNSTAAAPPIPASRDNLLAEVGDAKALIYHAVRQILDDLEQAAPWDSLYYPPANKEDFLRMTDLLILVIQGIPERVDGLVEALQSRDAPDEMVGDFEFFFHGIHTSVEQELTKLKALLTSFQQAAPQKEPTPDERDFSCELSADLKGKYSSSIMGASASLIAEGLWRGVEIEPILFPEKAKEFDRNEKLVATLSEVTENIQNLLEQVPLAQLVERWRRGERVDQYALTALYSLLGNLGKLMREDSRRALYSGDYHQIQRREALLAARVNELTMLHNTTWGTMPPGMGISPEDAYPRMVQAATELATVLSSDILKKIIGEKQVEDLFNVVMLEKEANASVDRWRSGHEIKPHKSRARIPEHLHSLIILLYDEDLNTFLELLLGSVLKRASLTVKKELENVPSPQQMEQMLEALGEMPATEAADAAQSVSATAAQTEEPVVQAAPEPVVQAAPNPAAPAPAPNPGIGLPGSDEEAAYRNAAPPEVPDIGVLEMPEIDFGHATPPEAAQAAPPPQAAQAAPPPQAAQAATPAAQMAPPPTAQAAPEPAIAYPEVDYSAIEIDSSLARPAAPETSPYSAAPSPSMQSQPVPGMATPNPPGSPPESSFSPSFGAAGLDFDAFEPPAEDFLGPPGDEVVPWQGIDFGQPLSPGEPVAAEPQPVVSAADNQQLMSLLGDLEVLVNRLTSSAASNHKSFLMIHRLLKRGRAIPPAMMQSMQPYLFDLMNELLPMLHEEPLEQDFGHFANRLIQDCQLLCQLNFSGDELKTHVAPAMQNIVDLLDELRVLISEKIDSLAGY